MDLTLSEEEREIREWVRTFVRREIMPLEPEVLARERRNERGLRAEELKALQDKAKESGFFGVHTPEEYGGMGLGAVMNALVEVELGRSFVQFKFGGDADNILYSANDEQKERYLLPTISGERESCFAITEPGAGSDARAIRTTARRDGDEWVVNGEKTFITGGNEADFTMVFAVTDPDLHREGRTDESVTCFLVDRDMGWKSEYIDTMGEWGPASLVFDDVRVPHAEHPRRGGQGVRAGDAVDRQGPLPAAGACPRRLRAAGRDGHGARPQPGHLRPADRGASGDPVDGRRLRRRRSRRCAGSCWPPRGRSTRGSTHGRPSRWPSCTAG